jgi:AraC-like DNA-binding protein
VQDSELSMAAMCTLFRARLGSKWAPLEVHFEHGGADRDLTLRNFFRARIRFGQSLTQILIASVDLDRPLRTEDAEVTPALERHARDLLAQRMNSEEHSSATLIDQARRVIGARLSLEQISVASIARDLGLSARSLQRGLAAEGTTMRNLLRDLRRELAEQRLGAGMSSHASIAQAIGYSDATVFWRAFKRWSGKTPSTFRERFDRNPSDNDAKPTARAGKSVRRRRPPCT